MAKKNMKWFYTNLPEEMGQVIDKILDKNGVAMALYSRQDYVKHAVREQMKKDLLLLRINPADLVVSSSEETVAEEIPNNQAQPE